MKMNEINDKFDTSDEVTVQTAQPDATSEATTPDTAIGFHLEPDPLALFSLRVRPWYSNYEDKAKDRAERRLGRHLVYGLAAALARQQMEAGDASAGVNFRVEGDTLIIACLDATIYESVYNGLAAQFAPHAVETEVVA